jgi:hypothetical protein
MAIYLLAGHARGNAHARATHFHGKEMALTCVGQTETGKRPLRRTRGLAYPLDTDPLMGALVAAGDHHPGRETPCFYVRVAPVVHEQCRQRDETGSILSLMPVCADIPQGAFALIRDANKFFRADPVLNNVFNGPECAPTSPFDLFNSRL